MNCATALHHWWKHMGRSRWDAVTWQTVQRLVSAAYLQSSGVCVCKTKARRTSTAPVSNPTWFIWVLNNSLFLSCSSGREALTNLIITDRFSTLHLSQLPSLMRQKPTASAFSYFFFISPSTMFASVSIISFCMWFDVYDAFLGIPLAMLASFSSFSRVYSINLRKSPEAISSSSWPAASRLCSVVPRRLNSLTQRNFTALPTLLT